MNKKFTYSIITFSIFIFLGFFVYAQAADEDSDGVPDEKDKCPGTSPFDSVDSSGCSTDLGKPTEVEVEYEIETQSSLPPPPPLPPCQDTKEGCIISQCGDGIDNDKNGCADFPEDSGCSSQSDTTENKGACLEKIDCSELSAEECSQYSHCDLESSRKRKQKARCVDI